ncbi:uroporphyrinogen decarboxylase [Clostridia bacterium]|nr:uroporphyrinogen decarboxylase [Clostridia bacterium]
MGMTRRERVIAALQHKETDFTPYYMEYTAQEEENLGKAFGKGFDQDWGYHLHVYQTWNWPENTGMPNKDHFRDGFGVVWNRSGVDKDIGVIDNHVIDDIETDADAYVFPPYDAARLRKELKEFLSKKEDKFTVVGIGFSVFERAWSLCGMENVFMAMIAAPDELKRLLNGIKEYNLKIMDSMLEFDFDAFYFGDDWGSQKGLMMGAAHWREFIKPVMKELYARAKRAGRYVFQHSCGDIEEILPDVIEIGLDCYQTFQPEIYDIAKIKQQFGDKLTFWGGVSTQQLLAKATPSEVQATAKKILDVMKPGGGYIFAPTHTVPHDVPPENIKALYEVMSAKGIR